MSKEETDLLPCPFCGYKDLYHGNADALSYHVQCRDCLASSAKIELPGEVPDSMIGIDWEMRCREKAKEAWNERV